MIKNSHLVLNCVPNSEEPLQITLCRTHIFVFFPNDFKAKLSTVRPFSASSILLPWSLFPVRWVSDGSDHSLLSYTLLVFHCVSTCIRNGAKGDVVLGNTLLGIRGTRGPPRARGRRAQVLTACRAGASNSLVCVPQTRCLQTPDAC